MRKDFMEWAYETLVCGVEDGYQMPGVACAFSDNAYCLKRYAVALDAYERLCQRLGVQDEDEDVEIIIRAFMDIERELCFRMYRYGAEFGMGEPGGQ